MAARFFFWWRQRKFCSCNLLWINKDNNEFVSFLCSDHGQDILTENNLSIHVEI